MECTGFAHIALIGLFYSNQLKNVPMFQQKAGASGDVSVCWDYHVILLCFREGEGQAVVYDIDSLLPYPCPLGEYLTHSFPYEWPFPFGPLFRVVPLDTFLGHFSSDRSHMRDNSGNFRQPPPPYAPIAGGENPNNLQEYLRCDQAAMQASNDPNSPYGRLLTKQAMSGTDFSTLA